MDAHSQLPAAQWAPLGALKKWQKNPRKNEAAVPRVARSIRRFGFVAPVVVWRSRDRLVAGHTRILAMESILREDAAFVPRDAPGPGLVPVRFHEFADEAEANAYAVADNKLAEAAEWDDQLLSDVLRQIGTIDARLLEETGFDGNALDRLISEAAASTGEGLDPGLGPVLPVATSKRGGVYQLGPHRLMCGDSASAADLDQLLGGAPIHLVNTDPPYNVKVEPRSNNAIAAGLSSFGGMSHHQSFDAHRSAKPENADKVLRAKDRPLANDFVSDAEFERLLRAWFGNIARVLVDGGVFYIWGGYANCGNYPPALKESGLYFSQSIIWNKLHPVLTRKDFMGAHEWAFYGWKLGAGHKFYGPNNVTDLWEVKKVNPQSMVHLTEKPVELAVRAIEYSTQRGENVLDLFGGSGSTLIAAQRTGRRAFLMEIDPLYADVIRRRWTSFARSAGCDPGAGALETP